MSKDPLVPAPRALSMGGSGEPGILPRDIHQRFWPFTNPCTWVQGARGGVHPPYKGGYRRVVRGLVATEGCDGWDSWPLGGTK